MPTELVADPMGAVWSKFVFNCVMNPLGALMMGDNAARHDSPEMRALVDDMAAECMAVVRALGGSFAFPPMEFVAQIRAGEIPMSKHAGSMALDIARGAADRNRRIDRLHRARGRAPQRPGAELPGGLPAAQRARAGGPAPGCKTTVIQ